jgi:hypothetical protein
MTDCPQRPQGTKRKIRDKSALRCASAVKPR